MSKVLWQACRKSILCLLGRHLPAGLARRGLLCCLYARSFVPMNGVKKFKRYMVLNWESINLGKYSGQQVPYHHSWIIRRHIWCFCRRPVHSAQCREFPHPLGQFLRSCWKSFRLAPFLWGAILILDMHLILWLNLL